MRFFTRNRSEPDLDPVTRFLIEAIGGRLDRQTWASETLRSEVASLRTAIGEREGSIVRDALEMARDNGRQVGLLQQQIAALGQPDALITLASEAAIAGLLEHINHPQQEEPANARS